MFAKKILVLIILSGFHKTVFSQKSFDVHKINTWYISNENQLLKSYFNFLSIPNTFNDRAQLDENARFISTLMTQAGIKSELIYDKEKTSVPAVFGEVSVPGATKTLVFYAHYDGMPVNPANWAPGLDPFKPQLVSDRLDRGGEFIDFPESGLKFNPDWRIYGRASADDKAGVFAIIKAYEAISATGQNPGVNIKFFFEGEEENGSVNLEAILENNREKLKGDLWVICDGPMPASGRKQITFGVRGDINIHLTVFGAKRPLHSGNYGNWAPNPAHKLVRLLASMKDDNGRVLIEGYYDDVIPLSEEERRAISNVPDPAVLMQSELGFAAAENKDISFLESITALPTLNINGITAANTGRLASNIIPATASAVLDLRMVKGNVVERQVNRVIEHIRKQGYHVVYREPTEDERNTYPNLVYIYTGKGYPAQRTPMDLPIVKNIIEAIQKSTDQPIVLMPSAGGSLPLYLFEKVTNTFPITIPIVNYDNNQHAENENLLLGHLAEGIKTIASAMMSKL